MKTFTSGIIAILLLLSCGASMAQTTNTAPSTNTSQDKNSENETESNAAFWQARFLNGGHYLVKLDRISSVSKHEYVGNGVARVVEVTVATNSAVVARIYWLEPVGKDTPLAAGQILLNQTQQVAQQVASKASPNAAKLQVTKEYPVTTHAHTVEYVVQEEKVLDSLYDSLLKSVNTNRGRIWSER